MIRKNNELRNPLLRILFGLPQLKVTYKKSRGHWSVKIYQQAWDWSLKRCYLGLKIEKDTSWLSNWLFDQQNLHNSDNQLMEMFNNGPLIRRILRLNANRWKPFFPHQQVISLLRKCNLFYCRVPTWLARYDSGLAVIKQWLAKGDNHHLWCYGLFCLKRHQVVCLLSPMSLAQEDNNIQIFK